MRRLLAAAAALAVLAAGCGGAEARSGPPPGRFLATSRSLTPTAHLFADPVVVRIDAVLDRERFDPDRVELRVSFLPYRIVDRVSRSREDFASFTLNGVYINLAYRKGYQNFGNWGRIIFYVDDVDAMYNKCIGEGLSPDTQPRDVLYSFLTWADQRLFTRGRA